LLAGDNKCEWTLWALSRYDIPREPDTPESIEHNRRHELLVEQRAHELELQNLYYTLDKDNWTSFVGRSGTKLTGKPDIIVPERDRITFEDCKGGRRKQEHHVQVLLYIQIDQQNKNRARKNGGLVVDRDYAGSVIYRDGVETTDLTRSREIARDFTALMERVNGGAVPRSPSARDCRYCKVRNYCDQRISREYQDEESLSD
jgi:hypothetical protein